MDTETEKYAHVTFFFNGGIEKQFEGEERHMIDSPKVATYDKLPKMSVQGVADKVAEVVKANKHEFVMCNFAPPDMVRSPCPFPIPSHPNVSSVVITTRCNIPSGLDVHRSAIRASSKRL